MIVTLSLFVALALMLVGIAGIIVSRSLFRLVMGVFTSSLGLVYLAAMSFMPFYAVILVASISGMTEAVLISFLVLLSKHLRVEDVDELRDISG
jgi:NADH:ubiquinone oxidoreductase subunit K